MLIETCVYFLNEQYIIISVCTSYDNTQQESMQESQTKIQKVQHMLEKKNR